MDVAYDYIQQEEDPSREASSSSTSASTSSQQTQEQEPITLSTEFQQAYQAVSASPWGAKLGGFFGQVKKQSESFYSDAQKEYASRSEQASKGLTGLLQHTRNISLNPPPSSASNVPVSFSDPTFTLPEPEPTVKTEDKKSLDTTPVERPESLPADIVKEATSLVSRFRSEAPTLLKRVQKAEDAADEALLKFGTNMRNWLRDAVTVTAPGQGTTTTGTNKDGGETELLFETNDAEGKRVFHSSRFDAQMHVIHTSPSSFIQDSESGEYPKFEQEFNIDKQTEQIAKDLDLYLELRRAMEKLVPEKVDYPTFWRRYYFLRKVIEEEERRRKEVLKGAAAENEQELSWGSDDSDSDNEEDESVTPSAARSPSIPAVTSATPTRSSAATAPPPAAAAASTATPEIQQQNQHKLISPAQSEEDGKSTAGSDASYDIVSGATSRAPGSPKEDKKDAVTSAPATQTPTTAASATAGKKDAEESDEEDWE